MEETNMTGNVAGNESLLIPLEGFQVQSFSCIAVSFENIIHDFLFVHLFIFAFIGSWEKCARCITYARMCLHVHACSRCCVMRNMWTVHKNTLKHYFAEAHRFVAQQYVGTILPIHFGKAHCLPNDWFKCLWTKYQIDEWAIFCCLNAFSGYLTAFMALLLHSRLRDDSDEQSTRHYCYFCLKEFVFIRIFAAFRMERENNAALKSR